MSGDPIEYRARLREKGQVTLPKEVRAELDLHEGDDMVFRTNEKGEIVIEQVLTIPRHQAWFWTEEWQTGEREAEADLAAGRYDTFDTMEELIDDLGWPQ